MDLLSKAKDILEQEDLDKKFPNMSIETFCQEIGCTLEKYEEALGTTRNGKVLVMKRDVKDRFINNYNPEMLDAFNANMDIQLALDPYAVITYIVSYMNKDETQMTKNLKEALTADAGKNAKVN